MAQHSFFFFGIAGQRFSYTKRAIATRWINCISWLQIDCFGNETSIDECLNPLNQTVNDAILLGFPICQSTFSIDVEFAYVHVTVITINHDVSGQRRVAGTLDKLNLTGGCARWQVCAQRISCCSRWRCTGLVIGQTDREDVYITSCKNRALNQVAARLFGARSFALSSGLCFVAQ